MCDRRYILSSPSISDAYAIEFRMVGGRSRFPCSMKVVCAFLCSNMLKAVMFLGGVAEILKKQEIPINFWIFLEITSSLPPFLKVLPLPLLAYGKTSGSNITLPRRRVKLNLGVNPLIEIGRPDDPNAIFLAAGRKNHVLFYRKKLQNRKNQFPRGENGVNLKI